MSTPLIVLKDVFEDELVPCCINMKASVDDGRDITEEELSSFGKILDKIFEGTTCADAYYTKNTDNVFFGVMINPTITNYDLMTILLDTEPMSIKRYMIELDSKLFSSLNEGYEIAAYIVEEIANMISTAAIENVRGIVDTHLSLEEDSIDIKNSVNYSQVLTYAIKDLMNKLCSLVYRKELDLIGTNEYAQSFELQPTLIDCSNKLISSISASGESVSLPNLSVLDWALMIYKDLDLYYRSAIDTLEDAKEFTGSQLIKDETDKTIKSLRRASSEVLAEATRVLNESKKGISLFASLKQSGLRSIEDDLYEYKIRLKNCETEDEAMYILRCINTRIAILDDYVSSTELSDADKQRWYSLAQCYRELRAELGKKKIGNKKSYGIFFDYEKLDTLDK